MKPYILGIIVIGILFFVAYTVFQENPVEEGFQKQINTEENCLIARLLYLQQNPDVARAKRDPWSHYRNFGRREGRKWPSCQPKVNMNFCPKSAPQIQTAKGNTDCCVGFLQDGKCSFRTMCTLSAAYNDIMSCFEMWKNYYLTNSIKQCFDTMPHYYEDVRTLKGVKGCSASPVQEDGKQPQNMSLPRCRIYYTDEENQSEMDSCFVEKEKRKVQCPVYPGYTSVVDKVAMPNGKFGSYICLYTNNYGDRRSCNDESSFVKRLDRENPNWRNNKFLFTVIENISCRTFLAREEARKRAEEERRRRERAERELRESRSRWQKQERDFRQRLLRCRIE
jgi:hypothetical protein